MRSVEDVEDYESDLRGREAAKDGGDVEGKEVRHKVKLYEACVPREFWDVAEDQITHNRAIFDGVIVPYCDRIKEAKRNGYGLLLLGQNGTGKTIFLSWVLRHVSTKTRWDAYYTTAPQLDYDIRVGWQDKASRERLEALLDSDFVAIDEMGKESLRDGDSISRLHIERILKARFDDRRPTLLATNALGSEMKDLFGESIMSIIDGKYRTAMLEPGDFRKIIHDRMSETMGYAGSKRD